MIVYFGPIPFAKDILIMMGMYLFLVVGTAYVWALVVRFRADQRFG